MKTRFLFTALLAVCLPVSDLCGQFNPNAGREMPPVKQWERNLLNAQAIDYAGPSARPLLQSVNGDPAAAIALLRCSPYGATQLSAFYLSGGLSKLPRLRDFLIVIAQPNGGDTALMYIVSHANELTDVRCSELFLQTPFDFILGSKQLPAAKAEQGDKRLGSLWSSSSILPDSNNRSFAWGVGLLGLVGMLILWKRRHTSRESLA
jgi:hypothetical protein